MIGSATPSFIKDAIAQEDLSKSGQTCEYLFRQYRAQLCIYALKWLRNKSDAEDIVQECFTKLLHRPSIIRNIQCIRAFLYRTVRNACLSDLKRKKSRPTDSISASDPAIHSHSYYIEENICCPDLLRKIQELIHQLPKRTRQVFLLYYIAGKKDAEISKQLATSPLTVRNQRLKAISFLRDKMPKP